MPSLTQVLRSSAATAGRLYPLKSGCGSLASSPLARRLVGSDQPVLTARLRNGARIQVRNDFVGRAAFLFGDLDPKVTSVLAAVLRPGDCLLDVGANVGVVSLAAATAVGPTGAVHAFEPQLDLVDMIRESAAANGFGQVHVHPVGLSDADAELSLTMPTDNLGAGTLIQERYAGAPGTVTTMVTVRQASEYLSGLDLPPIRAMKVDIEGHEETFLRGGANFFATNTPEMIVFEEQSQPVLDAPVVRLLVGLGYEIYGLPKAKLRLRPYRLSTNLNRSAHDLVAIHRGPQYEAIRSALHVED